MAIIDALAPRLLVCCEYFNLTPDLQAGVSGSRWPVATMDGTSMGEEINLNPLASLVPLRSFTIPDRMVRLRPCPVNDPLPDEDRRYYWSLFPGVRRHDGRRTRQVWGVSPRTRLVMTAIAPWARGAAVHLGRTQHFQHLIAVVGTALHAAGEPFELIVVCGAVATRALPRGRVRCVELLQPDAYEDLLLGSDLFVTDNVIQTSASKALAAGVPTLALINSTAGAAGTPLAEPYNIFPVALSFPTDSAYYRALAPVEIGDEAAVCARIGAMWQGEPRRGAEYFDALTRLRTPPQILDCIT